MNLPRAIENIKQYFNSSATLQNAAKASLASTAAMLFSYLLQVMIAAKFGAKTEVDAYLVANTLPLLIVSVISGGLTFSATPILMEEKHASEQGYWYLLSSLTNGLAIVLLLVCAGFFICRNQLIHLLAPGLTENTILMARNIFVISLSILFLNGISSGLSAALYANKKFVFLSINPAITNLISIIFMALFSAKFGIFSLVYGSLLGSLVRFFAVLRAVYHKGKYSLGFKLNSLTPFFNIFISSFPLAVVNLASYGNTIFERHLGSWFPEGSISRLNFALLFSSGFAMLFSNGLFLVMLPRFSEEVIKKGDLDRVFWDVLKKIFRVILPLVAIFLVLREPLVRIVLERGKFSSLDTKIVSQLILFYAGIQVSVLTSPVIPNILYALKKTWVVSGIILVGMVVYVIAVFMLIPLIGIGGLALAYSLTFPCDTGLCIFYLIKKGYLSIKNEALLNIALSFIATLISASAGYAALKAISTFYGERGFLSSVMIAGSVSSVMLVSYILFLFVTRDK